MNSINQETWKLLSRPFGDQLVARIALPEITRKLLCALDSQGNRHLLISIYPEKVDFKDIQSRGVAVSTRELVIQGQPINKYLDIECLDSTGFVILDLIAGEIAEELIDDKKLPTDIVKKVLAKWRRFWGETPQQLLSREEQIGLFAELWFFAYWLLPKFGSNSALFWRGPWGSRHDYEWTKTSVEIKATTNSRGRVHRINGINQLEKTQDSSLFLFSLVLREDFSAENTLPKLIDYCYMQVADSDEALTRLESGLAQVGYSPIYLEEYSKMRLDVISQALFLVNDEFPQLINSSFVNNHLPQGIEKVEYEINLNSFNHLVIANEPKDFLIK